MRSASVLLFRLAALAVTASALLAFPCNAASFLGCQARGESTPPYTSYNIAFTALAFGEAPPISFAWDFGDGNSSIEQTVEHTYAASGIYNVYLTVTDAEAQTCRDTLLVPVGIVVDPTMFSSASTRWGETTLTVDFSGAAGFVFDPPPYTWTWTFGDGGTSSLDAPTHDYTEPGTYWAVGTMHTTLGHHYRAPTLRITALPGGNSSAEPPARRGLRLDPAWPNPFGALTTLGFDLPRAGHVRLAIVDVSGRRVATLVDGAMPAGRQTAVWRGRTDAGPAAVAGLYFARLELDGAEARGVRIVRLP